MQGEVPRILWREYRYPYRRNSRRHYRCARNQRRTSEQRHSGRNPCAVENYFNIFVSTFVEVPRGCCLTVAAKNTSAQAISFANSNMIVERVS